jgi:hypothetical protein
LRGVFPGLLPGMCPTVRTSTYFETGPCTSFFNIHPLGGAACLFGGRSE